MKVCWYSNAPWTPTGYGVQTGQVIPKLAEKYGSENVAVAANYGLQGIPMRWDGVRIYPGGMTAFSDDVAPIHARQFFGDEPGLTITLFDMWVLHNPAWEGLHVASWVPVDHEPCPPLVVDWFKRTAAVPIAMSQFGARMLRAAGLDPLYIPHSIDTTVYRPVTRAPEQFGIPDGFVVGMVANNKGAKGGQPSRKGFAEAFQAFAEFADGKNDVHLYVHADQYGFPDGVDLERLAEMCGISKQVSFCDPYQLRVGYAGPDMAVLYSTFDVLLSPSYGEGFGVPVLEAQACGTPVIVNGFSAQSELVGAGWKVSGQPLVDMAQHAWWSVPNVAEVVGALEDAYEQSPDRQAENSARAAEFAAGYDTGQVWDTYWLPALEHLESLLVPTSPIPAQYLSQIASQEN